MNEAETLEHRTQTEMITSTTKHKLEPPERHTSTYRIQITVDIRQHISTSWHSAAFEGDRQHRR
jgi:hypothetical protein